MNVLTSQKVEELLRRAGIRIYRISRDEIYCHCPFHSDNRPSMSVNWAKQLWVCYAGCGGGHLRTLFKRLRRYDLMEEIPFPCDDSLSVSDDKDAQFVFWLHAWKKGQYGIPEWWKDKFSTLSEAEACINLSQARIPWNTEANTLAFPLWLPMETLFSSIGSPLDGRFGIGGFCVMYPHRKPITIALRGPKVGWGWHLYSETESPTVALAEGIRDAFHIYYITELPTIACLGNVPTEDTLRLLRRFFRCEEVILAFDYDVGGSTGIQKTLRRLTHFNIKVSVVDWPKLDVPVGTDPADLSEDQMFKLINSRVLIWG